MAPLAVVGFISTVLPWILALLGSASAPAPVTSPVIVPAGDRFTCTATRVWDGDGPIWCREGPRIRLANLATRELDDSCRPGHPCPAARGIEARDHLAELLGGATHRSRDGHLVVAPVALQCRSRGWGKGQRTDAACALPNGRDLSEAMIADGYGAEWKYR